LSLNDLAEREDPLVEVIVLSRNDPETGLRVMRSISHHGLAITRGVFTQGRSPFEYMPAFNMSLFLSANEDDVRSAIADSHPAGYVLDGPHDDDGSSDLRIAFDFDGVLADDRSESIYRAHGLQAFLDHEHSTEEPLGEGLLRDFLAAVNRIQRLEGARQQQEAGYRPRVRVSLVTARDGLAIERAIRSLKSWGVSVNDGFFLGGVEKARVIKQLRPHIFFDDQLAHLNPSAEHTASVHIPFGALNTIPGPRRTLDEPAEAESGE
jgi:5'-nucleotidase